MTDHHEEQIMEVEALESIYMEDFTKLSDTPLVYQIHIVPHQDGQDNHVALTLKCIIPSMYPDDKPELELILEKGLSASQQREMQNILNTQMEENLGMAMIYTICEAIREYLVDNNIEGHGGSEYHDMLRRMEMKKRTIQDEDNKADIDQNYDDEDEEERKRRIHGTPVTIESFEAWVIKFEAEMAKKSKTKAKINVSQDGAKLTGRQLWISGAVKLDGDENDGEDDDEDDEDYEEENEDDDIEEN